VTAKGDPLATAPLPADGEAPTMGPTAIMPGVGQVCPSCQKSNHLGVPHCVFCGSVFTSGPHAVQGAEREVIPPPPRSIGWAEGPGTDASSASSASHGPDEGQAPATLHQGGRRVDSDPPPASRRALSAEDSSDDILGPPIADPLIGVIVADRYRIVEPLGRGGMGIVYKVEHARIGKLLAMKLLTGELSRNPEVVRRFKQEALTVSKLSSPNTVQVFDFGASEGLTYLVMELVAGEDLARTLRALGPMPFTRLGKVIIQACTSLAEAHQKGIVHRDVKPENIMLVRGRDGTDVAKVLDFGLAKLREGAELNEVTSQGAIVGTPYYMAPEQIRGEGVDHRTDIYALGALMYRALTGHYPFNGPTPMAVFTKHLTEAPVPLGERAPELDIPAGANAIVLKALAKNPADRYQRVEDLQAALVDEVRLAGTSSVEDLLDSGQLRRLTRVSAAGGDAQGAAAKAALATRDEVERYERKLRRQRWGAFLSAAVFVAGAVFGGVKLFVHERAELTRGREIEPNDSAKQATQMPFGTSIVGYLGKRREPGKGDRDFYAVDVPHPVVSLKVTALPNFAMCTMLYRQGFDTALGQYCVGRPGRDLSIPALRLEPGRYFLAVLQDLDPYGGPVPFVHENVSDPYTLTIADAAPKPGEEIEPNDQVASANPMTPGSAITGTIGWARDEDVFCVPVGTPGAIRWRVKDVVRDAGAVLEATLMRGTLDDATVRVHAGAGKASSTDAQSPWTSGRVPAVEGEGPRCVRVRLTNDPWSGAAAAMVPIGGSEGYVIEVEATP
jgi:serine/threonine-protein kinase